MTVFKWKREYVEDIEFDLQQLPDDAYWELIALAMKEVEVKFWFDGSIAIYHEAMNDAERVDKTTLEVLVQDLVDGVGIDTGSERDEYLKRLMSALDGARKIVADAMPHN